MPINVICPGCHARFTVNEKYGGKEGPCPKCKVKIKIPKASDEIKVHERATEEGAKDAKGRSVLKPIARKDIQVSMPILVLVVAGVIGLFAVTFIMRSTIAGAMPMFVGGGLAILSPLIAYAGYTFLRNDEAAPFTGMQIIIRATVCGLIYAALWGVYALLLPESLRSGMIPLYLSAAFVVVGGLVALGLLELEFGASALHFCFYMLVTILLALTADIPLRADAKTAAPVTPTPGVFPRRTDVAPPVDPDALKPIGPPPVATPPAGSPQPAAVPK